MSNRPLPPSADAQPAIPLVCKPRQPYRTAGMIVGLPVLLAGYLMYHIGTNNNGELLTTDLAMFIAGLMLLCCILPGYLIAITGFSTVMVAQDAIRRYGVWGGGFRLAWCAVEGITLQQNRALVIKGPRWGKITISRSTHSNFDQAVKLVQQAAVDHDIPVRVMDLRGK